MLASRNTLTYRFEIRKSRDETALHQAWQPARRFDPPNAQTPGNMRAFLNLMLLLALASVQSGCNSWYAQPGETNTHRPVATTFQRLRMSPDSVVIEVAVARIDMDRMADFEQLWREIDTSSIKLEQRKRLDQNGIRAGVLSSHLPAVLQSLLEPRPVNVDSLSGLQKQMHEKGILKPEPRYLLHDGIQNRSGEMHAVPVSNVMPSASWTINNENKQTIGAGEHVRGFVELVTFPNGDGTVRMVCTPCLHLGQPKMQIAVQEDGFVYQTGSDKKKLSELQFETFLNNGQTLLLAPTNDLQDLGGLLFGSNHSSALPGFPNAEEPVTQDPANNPGTFRVLLVRILQTQMDDLFVPSEAKEKLTTTSLD